MTNTEKKRKYWREINRGYKDNMLNLELWQKGEPNE